MNDARPDVLISEEAIREKVGELAERISSDYAAADDLVLVGVLKGSFIFLADLARRVTVPHTVDFMALSTYGDGTTTNGAVRMVLDLRRSIAGKHVLVVEDIIDSGYTLDYLLRNLDARHPASLKTCVLVRKPTCAKVEVKVDYLGFDIPDEWVVGCGLDWGERFRTLPYIGVVHPETDGSG